MCVRVITCSLNPHEDLITVDLYMMGSVEPNVLEGLRGHLHYSALSMLSIDERKIPS